MTKIDTELHSHAAAGPISRNIFHIAPQKYTAFLSALPTQPGVKTRLLSWHCSNGGGFCKIKEVPQICPCIYFNWFI